MKIPKRVLPTIVIAQFFCTSLWFAGNAILPSLIAQYNWKADSLGYLTSAVQFGFILGTLIFAFLSLADRFSPSKLFFISASFGAFFNVRINAKGLKDRKFAEDIILKATNIYDKAVELENEIINIIDQKI